MLEPTSVFESNKKIGKLIVSVYVVSFHLNIVKIRYVDKMSVKDIKVTINFIWYVDNLSSMTTFIQYHKVDMTNGAGDNPCFVSWVLRTPFI